MPKKRPKINTHATEKKEMPEEDKTRFVEVLVEIMVAGNSKELRPSSKMRDDVKGWRQSLERRAELRATQSEKATLDRAQKTWQELRVFLSRHGLGLHEVEAATLERFLHDGSAQSRAYAALRWMKNNLHLSLPLDAMIAPKSRTNGPARGHACCAEPAMVEALEAAVIKYHAAEDPRWLALLSAWLNAIGVIRRRHLLRSEPLKVTDSTYYAWCNKGKQKHNRKGFKWTCPSKFTTISFDWAAKFMELWHGLPPEKNQ